MRITSDDLSDWSDSELREMADQVRELTLQASEMTQKGYAGMDRKSGGLSALDRVERLVAWARAARVELSYRAELRGPGLVVRVPAPEDCNF